MNYNTLHNINILHIYYLLRLQTYIRYYLILKRILINKHRIPLILTNDAHASHHLQVSSVLNDRTDTASEAWSTDVLGASDTSELQVDRLMELDQVTLYPPPHRPFSYMVM